MNGTPTLSFPPTSRYYGIGTDTLETAQGREIVYLKRRFLPPPERFAVLQEHRVEDGDRLDNITARYLNDPLQFWRIADANRAMNPPALTAEIGRRLRIALPNGVPGLPNVVQ
ncbi:LysM domain-containing protein [Exilibacterium tricleocarpae]|uniref:LysM domain-containing protein n=1 Tax=Exilibacterium tricleocarpae TaxID=2591008 RepID=A0A545TZ44_9GAMM|nr:LysM domain-containing protein [Exilibacterium tricleocarpae]TQV82481.1 LysM domain-containing protein [Exilibacterium tricleocarpae]